MAHYPHKKVARSIYLFGPHREYFWLGNFLPLKKQFARLASAISDQSSETLQAVEKFLEMIDLDREAFARLGDSEKPYWDVNMPVIELPGPGDGLLVYAPVAMDRAGKLKDALDTLGDVKVVIAPAASHLGGLQSFRNAYPQALFVCGQGSAFTGGLTIAEMAPQLGFHAIISDSSPALQNPGLATLFGEDFEVELMTDNFMNEIVVFHKPSKTLICCDLIYKSREYSDVPGVGGPDNNYIGPGWFQQSYQLLNFDPSPSRLLPDNRAFVAKKDFFDRKSFLRSLDTVLAWDADRLLCSHTDPIIGPALRAVVEESWGWLRDTPDMSARGTDKLNRQN
jgi:hypothetical protein